MLHQCSYGRSQLGTQGDPQALARTNEPATTPAQSQPPRLRPGLETSSQVNSRHCPLAILPTVNPLSPNRQIHSGRAPVWFELMIVVRKPRPPRPVYVHYRVREPLHAGLQFTPHLSGSLRLRTAGSPVLWKQQCEQQKRQATFNRDPCKCPLQADQSDSHAGIRVFRKLRKESARGAAAPTVQSPQATLMHSKRHYMRL